MVELNDDKVLYAFSSALDPVLTVPSGETVRICTKDCFGNQLAGPEDELDEIDWDAINPATGPIYVEGAVVGGALKVSIDAIEFDGHACSCTGKDEGVYGDRLDGWSTRFYRIEDGELIWDENVRIPLNPMIGVIGVAPAGEPVNCGTPGAHGGNMDNTAITEGATLYFPVEADGALFGLGDMHAVMGDGEVSVSGAEADGIVVSNHGGRQLDGVLSSARALPAIADAVKGDLKILADSGIRSGLDVVRMIALGADTVLIGRAFLWALAVHGQAGVKNLLELFEKEMRVAMVLTGAKSISEISRDSLVRELGA